MPYLKPTLLHRRSFSAKIILPARLAGWLWRRGIGQLLLQLILLQLILLQHRAAAQDPADANALHGHLGAVVMGMITPDSSRAVTAGTDQTARVWDLTARTLIREYTGHTGPLYCLALSGNGRTLVTGSQDNTLRVWDVPQPVPLFALAAHGGAISGLAMTPDGKLFVTTGADNKLRVWDVAALEKAVSIGAPIDPNTIAKVLSGHEAPITAVTLRPDGSLIATGDVNGKIFFWSPLLEQPRGSVEGPGVVSLAFNGNTSQLFSCSVDGVIRQWEIPPTATRTLDPLPQPITKLAVSKNQSLALVTTADQVSRLLQLDNGQTQREFPSSAGPVVATAISPSNTVIAIGSNEGTVRVLNASNGEPLYTFKVPNGAVTGLHFHSDNQRLFTTGADGFLRLWKPVALADANAAANMPTGSSEGFQWPVTPAGSTPLAGNSDASILFAGGADGKVRQVNSADGTVQRTLEGHVANVTDLAVAPNNQRLASVARDATLRLWNLTDGASLFEAKHPAPISAVSWSPDSLTVATAAEDGAVRLYAADSGKLLEKFSGNAAGWSSVAWLNTAGLFVTASSDRALRISKRSAARLFSTQSSEIVSMSLFGAQVLTGSKDGKLIQSDVNSGQSTREFLGCGSLVRAVAVSADNQRVAAAGSDGKLCIWNAANGELLQTLEVASPVLGLTWSADNQKLAVSTEDRQLRVYGPPIEPTPNPPASDLKLHQQTTAESAITGLLFAPDHRSLRTTSASGQLAVWAYASPTFLKQFNQGGAVYGVAISRDGSTIVSCGTDQNVRVWDNVTGNQRFQMIGHQGAVHSVALSPDESFAISSGADKTIRLWDVVGGRQLKQLATLDGTIYSVAIHPNGQTIAAAGADRKVYLMDMITGSVQRTLEGHTDYIHSVAFNPTGTRLLSYGYAGQVRIWDTGSGNLIWESRVGRIGNYASYNSTGSSVLLSSGDGLARLLTIPDNAR